jgi:hypothetical protein
MEKVYTRFVRFGKLPKRYEKLKQRGDGTLPTIIKAEVVKAIKNTRRRKVTGDDNIPVNLLMELGGSGLKIMTALVNKNYMSGDWPKDFIDVTMIALTNSLAYETRRFNAAFTRALQ